MSGTVIGGSGGNEGWCSDFGCITGWGLGQGNPEGKKQPAGEKNLQGRKLVNSFVV